MSIALMMILVGMTVAIFLQIGNRRRFDRVSAGGGDWLMVKHHSVDGEFFCWSFSPIIAWRLENGSYMPEILDAKELALYEECNPKVDRVFFVRDGLVFNISEMSANRSSPACSIDNCEGVFGEEAAQNLWEAAPFSLRTYFSLK